MHKFAEYNKSESPCDVAIEIGVSIKMIVRTIKLKNRLQI